MQACCENGRKKKFFQNALIFPRYANLSKLTLPINVTLDGTMMERRFEIGDLNMETLVEQRRDVRAALAWPVSVWLPEANRFFNGRSANISKTGVLVTLPITTPVRAGHIVEMNFPRTRTLAQEKGGFARIKMGKVVRVERGNMLKDGSIGVAVQFEY